MSGSSDAGQVTVLALGLCIVCFAVAGVALDGARLFIFRRSLQAAADAAAASAASALDVSAYYGSGGRTARLDPARAHSEALALTSERALPARVEIATRSGAVRVTLRAGLRTSLLSLVGIRELPVAAEATARPFLGDP